MKAHELIDTARTLVAGDQGLLAMDESNNLLGGAVAGLAFRALSMGDKEPESAVRLEG